ncbi:copper resistance CopC/CopD family protein [Streptomyces acidiscabies]|uniref:copper resistance CopC/CopD family protein n=1 Tax=Streptomyces acidiscabies TaxID=42234 RepID=UPI00095CBC68|nr:copper resistance protein CopC [Streptomyces acidiscabies]GAV46020.1 copper transport protein YcnJ precursor [Streptomyces acidiscabies]
MPSATTSRVRTWVLLFLAVTGALLAGAAPASAHAALTGSDPTQGSVVAQAPTQVTLTFSEKIATDRDSVRVLDPKGNRVDAGAANNTGGSSYAVPLRSGLPDGTYTVTYQIVSEDSHPVAGAYTFSIGAASETSVSASVREAGGGVVGALYDAGRYLSYAGFIVLVGGAAFVLACWSRGSSVRAVQRLVVGGWLTLTASTLFLLLVRGSYTGSGKVGDIFDLSLLGDVLQTKAGAALVSRLLLLAAAALFIAVLFGAYDKRDDEEKRDLRFGLAVGGTVVAAGLAASWALAEHASTGLQAGIAMPVDIVHLLAVAVWLGGLVTLLVSLYRGPVEHPVDAGAVRRFSQIAFGSVLALVATGIYQSWRQLGSWSAFTETSYGQLLLVKIGLVVVLVGIASVSRRWTGRLVEAGVSTSSEEAGTTEVKETAEVKETVTTAGSSGDDRKRASQLARQQAAVDSTRQKKLRDGDANRFGLRRSVLAEAGVAVVLLAVTTILTSTEPGRTELDAKAANSVSSGAVSDGTGGALTLDMSFDTGGAKGKGVVSVDMDPAGTGANELHVYLTDANGQPIDVPELKVSFTLESQKIGPLPVTPDHITTGHWAANGVQIPVAGEWKIAVTVRTSDIDQTTVSKNAQIG